MAVIIENMDLPVNQKQVTSKLETAENATSEGEESTMNQPKSKLDCISRQDAIKALTGWETEPLDEDIVRTLNNLPAEMPDFETFCGVPIKEAIEVLEKYKHSPSVTPKPVMTEEVREALMRLSMCAREECTICKYEKNCGFDKQVEMATENMHIILNAFDTTPTERTGEWIPVSERLPEDLEEVVVTWVNRNPPVYYRHEKDKPQTGIAVLYRDTWHWWDSTIVDVLAEYGSRCEIEHISEDIEIIAWRPLPEPYEGGDTE